MLTTVIQVTPQFTAFTFDGTQGSIDAFNAFLTADGGACAALFVNATTYSFKNPMYDNNFWPRDISEKVIVQKFPNNGATLASYVTALPQLSGLGIYWAAA